MPAGSPAVAGVTITLGQEKSRAGWCRKREQPLMYNITWFIWRIGGKGPSREKSKPLKTYKNCHNILRFQQSPECGGKRLVFPGNQYNVPVNHTQLNGASRVEKLFPTLPISTKQLPRPPSSKECSDSKAGNGEAQPALVCRLWGPGIPPELTEGPEVSGIATQGD